jgi:hypothetical protein
VDGTRLRNSAGLTAAVTVAGDCSLIGGPAGECQHDQLKKEAHMRKLGGFSIIALLIGLTGASAQTISRECAQRDLALVVLIEELGEAGVVPADKIAAAYSAMLEAREVCRSGRDAQALRMYEGVSLESQLATATAK